MSTIKVHRSVRAARQEQEAQRTLEALILDLKAAFIAAEHTGTRSVPTSKLREILDHHTIMEERMGKLRRPQRLLGATLAQTKAAPEPAPRQRAEISDADVERLIDQVAFAGTYEDCYGSLIVAPRHRVAIAAKWTDEKDSIPEADRVDFWQWAYQEADAAINGDMAAHLQPNIVRRQAC